MKKLTKLISSIGLVVALTSCKTTINDSLKGNYIKYDCKTVDEKVIKEFEKEVKELPKDDNIYAELADEWLKRGEIYKSKILSNKISKNRLIHICDDLRSPKESYIIRDKNKNLYIEKINYNLVLVHNINEKINLSLKTNLKIGVNESLENKIKISEFVFSKNKNTIKVREGNFPRDELLGCWVRGNEKGIHISYLKTESSYIEEYKSYVSGRYIKKRKNSNKKYIENFLDEFFPSTGEIVISQKDKYGIQTKILELHKMDSDGKSTNEPEKYKNLTNSIINTFLDEKKKKGIDYLYLFKIND